MNAGSPAFTDDWPALDVIVPTFNEDRLLERKLENLARLDYPRERVRFLIVDGQSDDGTREIAGAWPRRDARFVVLSSDRSDKTHQVNVALRHASAPWVVVTDADALTPPGTLRALMSAARAHPSIGVIGSPVMPVTAHPVEQTYWRILNRWRSYEWSRGSASIVMAPCYAFRRELIPQLAADTSADDVHVTWRIGTAGHAVGFAGPIVEEVRGPASLTALFRQKVRRAIGILREAVRFVPGIARMPAPLRVGFVVRLALFASGPLVLAGCAALLSAAASWGVRQDINAVSFAAAAGTMALAGAALAHRVRHLLALVALLAAASTVALIVFPFSHRLAAPGGAPARTLGKAR